MAIIKNVLKRNLPGIQSQRLWRTPRRPIVSTQSQLFQHPRSETRNVLLAIHTQMASPKKRIHNYKTAQAEEILPGLFL